MFKVVFAKLIVLTFFVSGVAFATPDFIDVKYQASENTIRFSFVCDQPLEKGSSRVFLLSDPERLVADVPCRDNEGIVLPNLGSLPEISGVRQAWEDSKQMTRFVVDLNTQFQAFDAYYDDGVLIVAICSESCPKANEPATSNPEAPMLDDIVGLNEAPASSKAIKVIIDPGHGGHDPGAISLNKTPEKDIVLDFSQVLFRMMVDHPHFEPELTRDDDTFVSLSDRLSMIYDQDRFDGADIFLSIHANYIADPSVEGTMVFSLSKDGASSEFARLLAESENSVARFSADDYLLDVREHPYILETWADVSMSAKINSSTALGLKLLDFFKKDPDIKVLRNRLEYANFLVLRDPVIPALLLEIGFVSNKDDLERITNLKYQERMSRAIIESILEYREGEG